jgi:hypothetical protein
VQTSRPAAIEGLTDIPSGSVTTALRTSEPAIPSGRCSCSSLTSREKSSPVGDWAAIVVGLAVIVGAKGSLPQPLVCRALVEAPLTGGAAGSSQEVAE